MYDQNYAVVDLSAIEENIRQVALRTQTPVMAVVKADAYGHGAVPVARHLEGKCAFFGVSSPEEALELRRAGIGTPILILGHTPPELFGELILRQIRPAIFSLEDARALSREAVSQGRVARFHFALDTGMSRIGFQPTPEAAGECAQAARLPGVEAEGLFSHYATADVADLTRAREQKAQFDRFIALLRERGVRIPLCHISNSAGAMRFSENYQMVRAGIAAYGHYPSGEVDPRTLPLKPALSWYSRICHVKLLPPGRAIGYGAAYVTREPTRVATVTVGYADGYQRSLSDRFYVLIRGKRAPILGRICMDQMMVDVTDIPEAVQGDTVVLLGRSGEEEITLEQMAQAAGGISYEMLTALSRRVPRQYLLEGKPVETVRYLRDGK